MRRFAFLLTTLFALALAGCGVRGNLEPPSAANAPVDVDGEPIAAPQEDRPFILDGLLL